MRWGTQLAGFGFVVGEVVSGGFSATWGGLAGGVLGIAGNGGKAAKGGSLGGVLGGVWATFGGVAGGTSGSICAGTVGGGAGRIQLASWRSRSAWRDFSSSARRLASRSA